MIFIDATNADGGGSGKRQMIPRGRAEVRACLD